MDALPLPDVFQRFTSAGRTYWLVPHSDYARFDGLHLDVQRLSPFEALLALRDRQATACSWRSEPPLDQEACERVLSDDRIRIYEQPRRIMLHGTPSEAVSLMEMLDEQPIISHWVEVRLHDDDGEPRAGEPYRVVLGDSTELEGRLDANGVARIPGIPPGPCQWFFPSLQPSEWARA